MLIQLLLLKKLIQRFINIKKNYIINEIIIPVILSIDAVSLHPYVTIENKNEVKGLVSKRVLKKLNF